MMGAHLECFGACELVSEIIALLLSDQRPRWSLNQEVSVSISHHERSQAPTPNVEGVREPSWEKTPNAYLVHMLAEKPTRPHRGRLAG